MIVVKIDNPCKQYFDMLMLPISCYNVFGNAYYAAFGEADSIYMWILDFFVEFLYLIDLGFNFT